MKPIFLVLFVSILLGAASLASPKFNPNKPCFWLFKWRFPPRIPPTPPIPITTTTPAQPGTTPPIPVTTAQPVDNPASGGDIPETPTTEVSDARSADGGDGQLDGVQDD
ncbi:hypothetical protein QE152_g1423 [Popillia japonica]|uniref:Uncharacterized protein n=1 Tax=Popillia japonica TaxID=7064 RepID=A0AAW1N5R3_POPJA